MRLQVIKNSSIWFAFSGLLIIGSFVSIGLFGLNFGIDFTGGTLMEFEVEREATVVELREFYTNQGFDAVIQEAGEDSFIVRTAEMTHEQHLEIVSGLEERYGEVEEHRFDAIGPVFGEELKRKSIWAMVLLLSLIVIYIAWAFRKVSEPIQSWKYGILTIVAAVHDIIIPLGIFAVLGEFYGYQIDTAFVAALLTILGYSINDSIVVFDRTRENLVVRRHADDQFADVVESSVQQSFARSINTSLTTLLVLLAILFFGGTTTRPFILALVLGVMSGVYSSISLASSMLVAWEKWSRK